LEKRPPSILFLAHSASRNGASILLLQLLRWLKARTDWHVEVLIDGRGPLLRELGELAPLIVWRFPSLPERLSPTSPAGRLHASMQRAYARALLRGRSFDLLYANTSAVWPKVQVLGTIAPAMLWHIHELEYALRVSIGRDRPEDALRRATRVVAVSRSVGDVLRERFGVPAERIDLSYGFVANVEPSAAERRLRRQRVLETLGWPADAFVVGGCGSLGWRKGSDLFLQIADTIRRTPGGEPARFIWVGGPPDGRDSLEFAHDLAALGLQSLVARVPDTGDAALLYDAMDAFALTSREDPFPLVMLEAGAHGLPVICFEKSGGACEFIAEGGGIAVPYLDVREYAARLVQLGLDRTLRERLGTAARQTVQRAHVVEVQGPIILTAMERCMTQAPGQGETGGAWFRGVRA
jgi:glycosyltransferase involved in cell wall biosynthesis